MLSGNVAALFGPRPVFQLHFGTITKATHRFCLTEEGIKDSREKVEGSYSFLGKNSNRNFQKEKDYGSH